MEVVKQQEQNGWCIKCKQFLSLNSYIIHPGYKIHKNHKMLDRYVQYFEIFYTPACQIY